MRLVIASNNAGKLREIKEIFGGVFEEILSMKEAGISLEVEEDGHTFEENAIKKAQALADLLAEDAVLSDDSGLVVDALGGAPGVYSARYAGEGASDGENNAKLLSAMQDVPDEKRTARFVSCVCLIRGGEVMTAQGACEGTIDHAPKGENGFGYDPLFISADYGESFGVLSPQQKNAVSHRARALHALAAKLGVRG